MTEASESRVYVFAGEFSALPLASLILQLLDFCWETYPWIWVPCCALFRTCLDLVWCLDFDMIRRARSKRRRRWIHLAPAQMRRNSKARNKREGRTFSSPPFLCFFSSPRYWEVLPSITENREKWKREREMCFFFISQSVKGNFYLISNPFEFLKKSLSTEKKTRPWKALNFLKARPCN